MGSRDIVVEEWGMGRRSYTATKKLRKSTRFKAMALPPAEGELLGKSGEWAGQGSWQIPDLFMLQCIQGFSWPRGRSKGKGLDIVWPGDHLTSDTSIDLVSVLMLPLWSYSPSGKAECSRKGVSGNAATECRYSLVFYKISVCTALSFGCAHPWEKKNKPNTTNQHILLGKSPVFNTLNLCADDLQPWL